MVAEGGGTMVEGGHALAHPAHGLPAAAAAAGCGHYRAIAEISHRAIWVGRASAAPPPYCYCLPCLQPRLHPRLRVVLVVAKAAVVTGIAGAGRIPLPLGYCFAGGLGSGSGSGLFPSLRPHLLLFLWSSAQDNWLLEGARGGHRHQPRESLPRPTLWQWCVWWRWRSHC